jgi:hypothetical protein
MTGINRIRIGQLRPRDNRGRSRSWRLHHPEGRVQSCELRDNTRAGAGWDVMLLENGEPLFSRQCENETIARYVAEAAKQDLLRTGWAEDQPNAATLKPGH